jgi:hypothetical protein
MKNRIINGAMVIDQRNAGASVTPTDQQYTLDRWVARLSQASKFTVQQNAGSVTLPIGFNNYLGCTSSSSYSVGSGDYFAITQYIEGFNFSDLNWGTANAKTVTLSFQVYSSLTGTFGGALQNNAFNRSYPFTYTISSANTWTTISVTITGDTSGTWVGATNGVGVRVNFSLGMGSTYSGTAGSWSSNNYFSATGATSVVGTNGATFYITGVQLEVGSSATSFDYRQYTQELILCQRYYWQQNGIASTVTTIGSGMAYDSTDIRCTVQNPVTMRTTPTITFTGSAFEYERAGTSRGTLSTLNSTGRSAESSVLYSGSGTTSGTSGNGAIWYLTNSGSNFGVSAEL